MEKGGAPVFSPIAYENELDIKWLSEDYFARVCTITRNPRYTNKRIMDPQLKCFVDEQGIEIPPEWGLPTPNPEASYKSLAKYGKNLLPMSQDMVVAMNLAWEFTGRHFGLYMGNSRVLEYAEAKAHMDMSTSSGAPFNQHYKTKQDLFEKDPEIDAWLEKDWEDMGNDICWYCLFTNSLKEELRTEEKLNENSIRTFLSAGVDAVVHGTRLFVDMNEKMYNSHLRTASAVGMSPYKGNWDQLYRKLKTFRKGYALDESQYDSSLRSYMMWGCARMRWNMLAPQYQTQENLIRIRSYYTNLVHSLVITPDGLVVMKKTGNPSGSCNTITDNTLILYTLMAYAWIMNAPEGSKSYEDFEDNTAKALVGDDNTWTVSDEAHDYYNARTVIEQWKVIGVTTTTDSLDARKPEELDFLSAHTVFMGGRAVPIYNRVKLMTSLLYSPKEHITPATTLERTAAMLGVGWTDLPFRRFCRDVIEWLLIKYDRVMYDDDRWQMAKCQIQADHKYYSRFTGDEMLTFRPQSLSGSTVKLSQPDKTSMPRDARQGNGTKPGKKTDKGKGKGKGGKRGRRARNGNATRTANVGKTTVVTIGKPRQRILPNGNLLVSHREFIQKVPGSVNFSINSDPINPGLPTQFKWLYPIAMRYESYKFRKLCYEFVNSKAGTFAGDVIMGVDYDASDASPFNEDELQSYFGCKTSQICQPMKFHANTTMLHKIGPSKFTRIGALASNQDIKLYDSGNFFIATTDCADTSNIGRLFVDYEVELMTPQVSAADILSCKVTPVASTAAAPCGTSFTVTGTLGVTWLSGTTFSVDVPGQYQIISIANGTVITAAMDIASVAAPSVLTDGTSNINAAATSGTSFSLVKIANATDVVTVSFTGTTLTANTFRIAPYTYTNV